MNLTEILIFSAVCILIDSWKGFGLERFTAPKIQMTVSETFAQ